MVKVLSPKSFLVKPDQEAFDAKNIQYDNWRNVGADALLKFSMTRQEDLLVVDAFVYDIGTQKSRFKRTHMKKNLDLTKGIFFSQRVLLELTSQGFRRDKAYRVVQKCAIKSLENNIPFYDSLLKDKVITDKIPVNTLKKLFDFSYHTRKINVIFNRVLTKK